MDTQICWSPGKTTLYRYSSRNWTERLEKEPVSSVSPHTEACRSLLLEGAGGGRKDTGGVPVPSFTLYVVECPATTVVAILQSKRLTCRVARASDRGISAMVHARVRPCRELPRSEPTALK